jgi:hypothetical protein
MRGFLFALPCPSTHAHYLMSAYITIVKKGDKSCLLFHLGGGKSLKKPTI